MDKKHWVKELLGVAILVIQAYIESGNKLRNLEKYAKRSIKNIVIIIIISIPVLLTIWGGMFLGLFFYLVSNFNIANYTAALIIAGINTIVLVISLIWFKHKMHKNKPDHNGIDLLLITLIKSIKTIKDEATHD